MNCPKCGKELVTSLRVQFKCGSYYVDYEINGFRQSDNCKMLEI